MSKNRKEKYKNNNNISRIPNILIEEKTQKTGKENLKIKTDYVLFKCLKDFNSIFSHNWELILKQPILKKAFCSHDFEIGLENHLEHLVKMCEEDNSRQSLQHFEKVYFDMGTPLSNQPGTAKIIINETSGLLSTIVNDWDTFNRGEMEQLLKNLDYHTLKILAMVDSVRVYFIGKDNYSTYLSVEKVACNSSDFTQMILRTFQKENDL